jgi:hypothetical protein
MFILKGRRQTVNGDLGASLVRGHTPARTEEMRTMGAKTGGASEIRGS